MLRRSPSELGETEGPLVEEALKRTASDRRALRSRLVARLAMVSPKSMKKQLEALAEGGGNPPPRPRASVFRVAALLPGSGAYHAPHSSTTRATFFCGSYLSMIAECFATSPSISSVDLRIWLYSFSPNPTEANEGGHRTTV